MSLVDGWVVKVVGTSPIFRGSRGADANAGSLIGPFFWGDHGAVLPSKDLVDTNIDSENKYFTPSRDCPKAAEPNTDSLVSQLGAALGAEAKARNPVA
jgi:hypothetical protein